MKVTVTECSYEGARISGGAVCARLLTEERFEDHTHLADYTLADVVDEFWPAADGWQVIATEPAYFWPLWILEHPTCGVAVAMIGATEPSGGPGSPESWEELSVFWRARNIHMSITTHGPTRLAILQEMAERMVTDGMRSSEESMVAALLDSPTFNTPDVATMRALGAFDALDARVQDARKRAAEATEKADRIKAEKALLARTRRAPEAPSR